MYRKRGGRREPVRTTFDVNLGGTITIAEAIRRQVVRAQIVFVSTGEMYGARFLTARGPVDEQTPIDPMSAYAASKATAELFNLNPAVGENNHARSLA